MKIIALISQKGGVGKSTLSQALAVEAKKRAKKLPNFTPRLPSELK